MYKGATEYDTVADPSMYPPSHDTVAADDDPSIYAYEASVALWGLPASGVFQLRATSPVCVVECAEGTPSWPTEMEEVD